MVEYLIEYFTGSQRATLYYSSLNANYIYQVGKMTSHPNVIGKTLTSPIGKRLSEVQEIQGNFKASAGNEPFYYSEISPFVYQTIAPIVTLSPEVQTILTKFDNGDYLIPNGVNAGIDLVKSGSITNDLFLITFNNLINTGIIIDETIGTPVVTAPVVTLSAEVQAILTKFDNNDYTFPSWFNNNIRYVRDGSISSNEFLNAFNNLLQAGTIIDKTIPVEKEYDVTVLRINEFGGVYSELFFGIKGNKLLELESQFLVILSDKPKPTDDEVRDYYNFVDTSIETNMVSQSIGAFTLKDGKVTGKIIYIAESAFNSYYYNKPVTSIVQIKDQVGSTIVLKTNNLNFTETQRDETITINEGVGDVNAVKIEFYVWKNVNEPLPFTLPKIDEIVAQEIGLAPCPIGQHRNFNNKCVADDQPVAGTTSLLGKFMGVTALIGTLALLGSKRR